MTQTRECINCHVVKPLDDFYKDKSKPQSRQSRCKVCKRADMQKRRDDNPEIGKAYWQRLKARRKINPDLYAKRREWETNRRKDPIVRANELCYNAQRRATERGLEYSLSQARVEVALLIGKCERTGIRFVFTENDTEFSRHPYSPSLDKIDAFGGYTDTNVAVVCNAYNIAKNQMSEKDFFEFCRKIVEYNS